MTLLYFDPCFLNHDTGTHPESAERLRAITARLEKTGLAEKCDQGTILPLAEEVVQEIHSPEQVHIAKTASSRGGGYLDFDTPTSADSFKVALAAAGACVGAVETVLKGEASNALCLVRPPGHHATPTRSMGFCLFNNIALAAYHAKSRHQVNRILIVDWDVHHGNGTQDIFYEDGQVMFYSIHRYGHGFYPGTGSDAEKGSGRGLGYILNVPVAFGTSRKDYQDLYLKGLETAADHIKPELVLVSAGFDAHVKDPIGSLGLETEDFAAMTRAVRDVARTHAGGKVVSCLEGGYHLTALAESVQAHLEELLR